MAREAAASGRWAGAGGFAARLARFLDTVPEGTMVVDEAGVIRLANTQVAEIFGYPPRELVGRSVEELVPEEERARHRESRADFARNPRDRPMGRSPAIVARRKDGSLFRAEIELRPRLTPDGLMTLTVVRDRGQVDVAEGVHLAREAQRRLHLAHLAAEDLAELVTALAAVLDGVRSQGTSSEALVARIEEAQSTTWLVHELIEQLRSYASEEEGPHK